MVSDEERQIRTGEQTPKYSVENDLEVEYTDMINIKNQIENLTASFLTSFKNNGTKIQRNFADVDMDLNSRIDTYTPL